MADEVVKGRQFRPTLAEPFAHTMHRTECFRQTQKSRIENSSTNVCSRAPRRGMVRDRTAVADTVRSLKVHKGGNMTNFISIALAGSISALTLISTTAAAQDGASRQAMSKEEVAALLNGKLTLIDKAQGRSYGNVIQTKFEDGKVQANSSSGMYNTGPFQINENGEMCQQWSDTRWGDRWCYSLYRDGDVVQFKVTAAPDGRPLGIVKWEYTK